MVFKKHDKLVSKLLKQGKKENIDYRIVHFNNKIEVKMINRKLKVK